MSVNGLKVLPGNQSVGLTWTLPTGAWAALVKWRVSPSGGWNIMLAVDNAQITGLVNGTKYDIQIVPLASQSAVNSISATPVAPVPTQTVPVPSNSTVPSSSLWP